MALYAAAITAATALLALASRPGGGSDAMVSVLMLAPLVPLLAIAAGYGSWREYLFSAGFWLLIAVLFYICIKAFAMYNAGQGDRLRQPLVAVTLFLLGYAATCSLLRPLLSARSHQSSSDFQPRHVLRPEGLSVVLAMFVGFKVFGTALVLSTGGGDILSVAAETQNEGAGYLYRLPFMANPLYLFVLHEAYRSRKWYLPSAAMTMLTFAEGVYTGSRYQIIILLFWNLYLYHRYVRPVSLFTLALLSPAVVFVIVIFGYARNIELGDLTVLLESVEYLAENSELIFMLFMERLDMLPQMASAFRLHELNQLPTLYGASYIYFVLHAIPRSIWPDKPPLTAALVTAEVNPGPFSDGVLVYPSIVLEGMLNLGWGGVLIAGFATGVLSVVYDRMLVSGTLLKTTWAMLFFTFPMGLFVEGVHSNYVANIMYVSVLYAMLVALLVGLGSIERRVAGQPAYLGAKPAR